MIYLGYQLCFVSSSLLCISLYIFLISFLHLLRFTIGSSFFSAHLFFLLCLTASFLYSLTFHSISFCSSFFLSFLPQFHILQPLSLSNLSMHIDVILFIEIPLWLLAFHREFEMDNHASLPFAFSFLVPVHLEKYNNMHQFQYYSGSFVFLLETCQCITNNKKSITTFTFTFSVT